MTDPRDIARELGADMSELTECSCEEVRAHLYELLDQELSSQQMARLKKHAQTCPSCTKATQAETHLRILIRRSCCQEAPSTLRERVVTQISTRRITW